MPAGSVKPETEHDVECDHCGRYFHSRGIKAHERDCPERGDGDGETGGEPETVPGGEREPAGGDTVACPSCSTTDPADAAMVAAELAERGELSPERRQMLDNNEYVCRNTDCLEVF